MATVSRFPPDTRQPVDTCADYLLKYAPYLQYDRYLAARYPIATGVVEGACRHLVPDRMELTDAPWHLAGAEAVLKIRFLAFLALIRFPEHPQKRPLRCPDGDDKQATPSAPTTHR